MEKERHSGLRFKVHMHEHGTEFMTKKEFAPLFRHTEFKDCADPNRNRMIRYICYLYDPGSDLQQEFQKLPDRKEAAALEAGFQRKKNGDWPEDVEKLFDLSYEGLVGMILRFLQILKNAEWDEMCTLEQELEHIRQKRWNILNEDSKSKTSAELLVSTGNKLMDMAEARVTRLQTLKKQFWQDNSDVQKAVADLEMVTPENVDRVLMKAS